MYRLSIDCLNEWNWFRMKPYHILLTLIVNQSFYIYIYITYSPTQIYWTLTILYYYNNKKVSNT